MASLWYLFNESFRLAYWRRDLAGCNFNFGLALRTIRYIISKPG